MDDMTRKNDWHQTDDLHAPKGKGDPFAAAVRANAARGYEMIPGTDHFTYLHPVHVNAFGLRGPERAPLGAAEVRVLCSSSCTANDRPVVSSTSWTRWATGIGRSPGGARSSSQGACPTSARDS